MLIVNRDGSEVPEALAEYLRRFQPEWVERYCLAADLTDIETGALYANGVLQEILPPSTRRCTGPPVTRCGCYVSIPGRLRFRLTS